MLKWWQKAIVYQVYPKSFCDTTGSGTGDIKGITSKLDYLHDLGIGAIWLTPVYPSPMVDNGYDISDYTGIGDMFGTMKDFDELIAEAGKRDIKIVMDLVFNHCSDQHKWFQESRKSSDNSKSDWFIWRDAKPDGSAPTNWRSIFGGSVWTWCEERGQYYFHTFASEQPDLNWENPDVRRALYDAANFWLKKGVGGFRIDAITYIKKPAEFHDGKPDGQDGTINVHLMIANTPGILDFLHEMKREVFDGHDIFTVGEANGVSADELPQWVGKDGVFDMLFEFSHVDLPFNDAEIWCYPRKWKLTELKSTLTATREATKNSWCPVFFENHDQPRSVNHFFPSGYDTKKSAKVLAMILLTIRGTPFIYQGEELGMTNVSWEDINIYDDISTKGQYAFALNEGFSPKEAIKHIQFFSRDNSRTPMQWNAEANAGFTSGKSWLPVNENYIDINAEAEAKDENSVLSWYKKLIEFRLKKSHEVLTAGSYREIFADSEEIFAYERELDGEKIIVVVNFTDKNLKLPDEYFADKRIILTSENNFDSSELQPLEARLYE
ncbi:MAG: alpha-glucosidase [Synergistaceae bacterium]|nr:alpha-glucosidase [Synergistaceae bacterium]